MDQTPSAQTSAPPLLSSTPQPTEQPPSQLQAQAQAQTQAPSPSPSPSPSPNPPPPTTTAAATPSPSLPPPTTSTPPALTTSSSPSILPSTNLTPKPLTTQSPQPRPPTTTTTTTTTTTFNRPWQQPSPYTHFSLPPSPTPPLPSSTSPSSPAASSAPRGGMAIGVPAHHPTPPSPSPTAFSSINPPSFGQKFGGLGRSVPDSMPSPSTSQVRQPIQGMQGMGMMGSLGSSSAMRPAGVPGHQFRPVQSSVRPPNSPTPQSPTTQNFQGHGMLRVQSVGSSGSSSSNTAQSLQPQNQPWLSSGTQGKPPLPPASLRPQMSPQSLQQRSHIPQQQQQQQHQQQHQTMPTTSQQPQMSSSQQAQQPSTSSQPQEQFGQHYAPPRVQLSAPHQQQLARGQGLGIQRPSSHGIMQSGVSQPGALSRTSGEENGESCNRIMSKRTIQELLTQIDPSEKLDPEVEDVLVDIAEEFVDSITTFGCSLAKHRKSTVLESKDILLHLERNWNITLPGFSGDEIKTYRKPATNDIHRERLAAIKKSIVAGEATNLKSSAGQASGNTKSHLAKGPANILGSPNPKIREAA